MKIIVAEKAGFCYGVNKAVDILRKMEEKPENLYTFGALIHNPQYIEKLRQEGVGVKNDIDEIQKEDTIIIRSHGISDDVMAKIKEKGARVIDATCPFVKSAQFAAKKLEKDGYSVIIAGDKEHAEIRGILGDLKHGIAVSDKSELSRINIPEKVGVIAQTTINKDKFDEIIKEIQGKAKEVKIINTICSATREKQQEAIDLAGKVEILIVIGGKNSSNTAQLKKVTENITRVYHIEDASEIDKSWFGGVETAGVTAGASTPNYLIEEVVEKLRRM